MGDDPAQPSPVPDSEVLNPRRRIVNHVERLREPGCISASNPAEGDVQATERPIDLSAARRARALANPTTVGDRWANLHGITSRPTAMPSAPATVIQLKPGR